MTSASASQRYEGFGEGKHPGTRYPSFAVKSRRGVRSTPTALARTHRAPPRRPRSQLGPQARRRLGVKEARRQPT